MGKGALFRAVPTIISRANVVGTLRLPALQSHLPEAFLAILTTP